MYQVLCWAATTLAPTKRQLHLTKYSKSGHRDVAEYWRSAAQRALRAADWVGRPQIRTLQVSSSLAANMFLADTHYGCVDNMLVTELADSWTFEPGVRLCL